MINTYFSAESKSVSGERAAGILDSVKRIVTDKTLGGLVPDEPSNGPHGVHRKYLRAGASVDVVSFYNSSASNHGVLVRISDVNDQTHNLISSRLENFFRESGYQVKWSSERRVFDLITELCR